LNLIEETLKIMASQKLKTAAIAGTVVILTAGTIWLGGKAVHAVRATRQPNIQGAWEGTLSAGDGRWRLVLKVDKTNGVWHATMDSIDQNAKDIPITKFTYKHPSIQLEAKAVNGTYQATLNKDATEMSGTWKQGTPLPLVLKRTTEPDVIRAPMAESEYTPRQNSDLQGYWRGTVKVNDNLSLRVALKIAEHADGTFRVDGDSIDQGARNMPASAVTYHAPVVRIEFGGLGGVYEGRVNTSDKEIIGAWVQGETNKPLPLNLSLADPHADQEQEANKDYSHVGPTDLPGHWKGTLDVKQSNMKFQLVLNIARMPDGTFFGSLVVPDQGGAEIPASLVQYTSPAAHLEWKAIGASFYGKLENGKLNGAWRQGGGAIPLVLERTVAQ
jgi:hypothetical protein